MTPGEIEAALQAAIARCNAVNCPLDPQQQEILLQVVLESLYQQELLNSNRQEWGETNPLDELTLEQRQSFLQFVREKERQDRPWKIQLMNDWLQERDSGSVQFIRDRFGLTWLNRVQPSHFEKYLAIDDEMPMKLKVGDRIEVSNALWEWVQDDGPCSCQWFAGIVLQIWETGDREDTFTSCIVRILHTGMEYEVQGIYQWNRYYWRWI
jgi:ribosomal protein L19